MRIKKGDIVLITSGKDRGKKGKVLAVFPKENRLLVEGMNIRKKRIKPKKAGEKGQMVESPTPLALPNTLLICPKCGKATRLGAKIMAGKKSRVCKKCNQEI